MAKMGSVWRTEYVAEGAMISEKQFEELAEIANRLIVFARKLAGAEAKEQSS